MRLCGASLVRHLPFLTYWKVGMSTNHCRGCASFRNGPRAADEPPCWDGIDTEGFTGIPPCWESSQVIQDEALPARFWPPAPDCVIQFVRMKND